MKLLIIGGGGREHALAWKLAQSPLVRDILVAPGNAGTAQIARNVPIPVHEHDQLLALAETENVDFTIVGPEAPLVAGLVDQFEAAGQRIFGPRSAAARLEGSKTFAKQFMARHGVPTASFVVFDDRADAVHFLTRNWDQDGWVIKADGLAAGKGVWVPETQAEAYAAVHQIDGRLVIERKVQGVEVSVMALVDGDHFQTLPWARDHKRLLDGDQGPNTGGMGAICPIDPAVDVDALILAPTLAGLKAEGTLFRGVLFAGLMLTADGPIVLEYNCRFGDPETQVVLPLLQGDILPHLLAVAEGRLRHHTLPPVSGHALGVVAAAHGYPGTIESGVPIQGIEPEPSDALLFHAGTREDNHQLVVSGGRTLVAVGVGTTLQEAKVKAYRRLQPVRFGNRPPLFRRDIGGRE